jgi:hypothetical protein
LREGFDGTGDIVVPDMRTTTSLVVTGGDADKFYTIEFSLSETASISLVEGWNLVSLPVTPDDSKRSSIFPDADVVYRFDQTYIVVNEDDDMEPGIGYWVKMPAAQTYQITGQAYDSHTGSIAAGWHLMGATNADDVTPSTTPADQITVMYGFDSAYYVTSTLSAGNGYWVKVADACDLSMGN